MRSLSLFPLLLLVVSSLLPLHHSSPSPSPSLSSPLDPPTPPSAGPPAAYTPPPAQRSRTRRSVQVLGDERGSVLGLPSSIRGFRFNAPRSSLGKEGLGESKDAEGGGETRPTPTLDGGGSTPSPYPHFGEPTVDELTLSPLVLVVTVDGNVHALQRDSGRWVWTLHDDGGAGSPSSAGAGGTGEERERRGRAGEALGGPLVRGRGRRAVREREREGRWKEGALLRNQSGSAGASESGLVRGQQAGDGEEEEEDEVYVIEPHSQGDIYLYTRGKSMNDGEGGRQAGEGMLQKLPLSMQQLVSLSPFTFPTDSSRMFVGRKETKLVGVDLRTGRLVGVFGSGSGWCEWDEAKEGRVRTEEECEEEIERRPEDLLYMARTEYHLSIYSKTSSSLLQTLTYSTYTSSSPRSSLQSQWTRTPDSRYLQPMHDGSLICFLSGVAGLQWSIAFEAPVVSVFDIATPPSDPSNKGDRAQPLMFEQPHPLPVEGLPKVFDELQGRPDAAFIGSVGGEPFAMSRENFPLVAFAPSNKKVEARAGVESVGAGEEKKCRGIECLYGRHDLPPGPPPDDPALIDPPSKRLGIEGPPVVESPSPSRASEDDVPNPNRSTPPPPGRSSVLASIYRPVVQKLSRTTTSSAGLLLLIVALASYFYTKKVSGVQLLSGGESVEARLGHAAEQSSQYSEIEFPPSPPPRDEPVSTITPPSPFDRLPLSPPPELELEIQPEPLLPASSSDPLVTKFSPLIYGHKELPPLPPPNLEEDAAGSDSDGEFKDPIGGETGKKKSRRRRGKKTKKVKIDEALDDPEGMEKDLGAITLSAAEVKDDEVGEMARESTDPRVIGGLYVSETVLGYGSHGTVVLKGEFQGRAVAVKRLLKDFVTIATQEVALLQESDDHPHVIRYFCKEQRDTFLYIALELCPASLYDLIDQPTTFPDLVQSLDPKRALRQITSGLRHLHKLKIVHRDIKPQNILVSTSKHQGGGVRMLISDFGLCKKLDKDESSFQQTFNHAAGSFGYRAPEVLRGQVDPNSPLHHSIASGGGSESGSSGTNGGVQGLTTDPSMRLTTKIDIFSLGCIFYYVLTGGEHPFGGRYEREMNILKGNICLERLDGLGDEAVEVQHLITSMVATDPRERPSAQSVLLHPFFWTSQKRLLFLCDASDRFEIMERDPPAATLVLLEEKSKSIVGDDWQKCIDKSLLENLGKYRKYDGSSVRDLLRVLRNKKHHYQDLPTSVRTNLGDLPSGFLSYFTSRFPLLLLHVYDTVDHDLRDEPMFKDTFTLGGDETI